MSFSQTETCPAAVAETILQGSSYLAVRFLNCRCQHGVLTITGRVPSFYLKQVAQKAVSGVKGVKEIRNLVEVAV